jgi:hypothetical protein
VRSRFLKSLPDRSPPHSRFDGTKGRLQLSDGEKRTLAEIAHRLGRKVLAEVAVAAKPDTDYYFERTGDEKDPAPIGFFCISAIPITEADPPPTPSDLLEGIDALQRRGCKVFLFRERELYSMTDLVNSLYKRTPALRRGCIFSRFRMGIPLQ